MRGYRKLIMFVVLAALTVAFKLTPEQADVLITLAWAGIGGNVGVHAVEVAREAMAARNARRSGGSGGADTGEAKP